MKTVMQICVISFLGMVLYGFTQDDIYPKGWFKVGLNKNGFRIGLDSQVAYHGQKSAFIQSYEKQPSGFCGLWQSFSAEEYKNKRVKLTGYVKSEGTVDTAFMCVRIDDFDRKMGADFDNMENRPIIGTRDWERYEIIFDVPESKCTINFGFGFSGSGKAWIDNFVFEIVDKSTDKTAGILTDTLPASFFSDAKIIPVAPVNLDFEEERLSQNF